MSDDHDAIGAGATEGAVARALRLGEHYEHTGQIDRAIRTIEEAIAENPEDADLHARVAWFRHRMDRTEDAVDAAERALALDPENIEAIWVLGDVCRERGENTAAEAHFLEGLRIWPDGPFLLRSYGHLMLSVGELDKARKLLEASRERDPEDEVTHSLLGLLEARRSRTGESFEHSQRGLEVAPDASAPHLARAAVAFGSGRIFRARRSVREALRIDPTNEAAAELHDDIDLHARWLVLPYYIYSVVVTKLPGEQFLLWGGFIALSYGMKALGVPNEIRLPIVLTYVGFCLYTWVAVPIGRAWVRLRPSRFGGMAG